jgi:D-lactate dehydrogenase
MAADHETPTLLKRLRAEVGVRHVLTGAAASPYATGYRFGGGALEAAVRPGSLVELWRVAQECVAAGRIVIVQAANTGLTGGSTPDGTYDRPVVVLNTNRIKGIHLIHGGKQVVCLAGATLYDLERTLEPVGREPHSVIGSSCIGASVVGGVCNNSGGALVRRGPAYTEYALYARVRGGRLELCNRLGIRLAGEPEEWLRKVEAGDFGEGDLEPDHRAASAAAAYEAVIRSVDEDTPARFNADPARLFEASGSAGKLVVFAVRLDTFPKASGSAVFYVGTDDPGQLALLRRRILTDAPVLPVSGEYIHREAFDLADRFGKDTVIAIRRLGTDRLPLLFALKAKIDRAAARLPIVPRALADRALQTLGGWFPDHLPARLRAFRARYEHHLILKVDGDGVEFARTLLAVMFQRGSSGAFFQCTAPEEEAAMLHRFAVAGAAVRYRALHDAEVEDIVALDIALPRNASDWFERLPPDIEGQLVGKLYYGHFFCHVFHQDYLVKRGFDPAALEGALLELMDARGAEYPAEHNVGHLYRAKPALAAHYRALDPANALNPGIGKTSRRRNWQ